MNLNRLSFPSFFIPKSLETALQRKEIFKMTSEEKSAKMERAERKLKQAQAEYRKALRGKRQINRRFVPIFRI